jgi:hypothetical protein
MFHPETVHVGRLKTLTDDVAKFFKAIKINRINFNKSKANFKINRTVLRVVEKFVIRNLHFLWKLWWL